METDQIRFWAEQNRLLERIASALEAKDRSIELGFVESERPCYVYCNRSNGGSWYRLNEDRQPVVIPQSAIRGYVTGLEFKQVERRNKETFKMHLTMHADKLYVLEAGYDSHFSKGVISALATLDPMRLRQPITIEPRPADSDEVLFCQMFVGGERIYAPYSEDTSWKTVARRAIDVVKAAVGGGNA